MILDSTHVLSVSELTDEIRNCLNGQFAEVWVSGEVSGLKQPQSGHIYLNLKDDQAQLAAVVWRSALARLNFVPEDGLEVLCRGHIDVYPKRGSYQLIVQAMQPLGVGALQLAFRQLHMRLKSEGLFDPEHKLPLPSIPRRVAVVTSPTGAAIHDFLQVVNRRWPHLDILVVPVKVQGPGAAMEIATAVEFCGQDLNFKPEVIVVTRGGGSLEDLWAFNEEPLVRAIFNCPVPVISAVGHEINITLSDLVADLRALTPSEAGEKLVPDKLDVITQLDHQYSQLNKWLIHQCHLKREQLQALADRPVVRQPIRIIQQRAQLLDSVDSRLAELCRRRFEQTRDQLGRCFDVLRLSAVNCLPRARLRLQQLANSTAFRAPAERIAAKQSETLELEQRLKASLQKSIEGQKFRVQLLSEKLAAFDPHRVLSRGYSLTLKADGTPLVSCQNAGKHDKILTWLSDGRLTSRIEAVESGLNYANDGKKEDPASGR